MSEHRHGFLTKCKHVLGMLLSCKMRLVIFHVHSIQANGL